MKRELRRQQTNGDSASDATCLDHHKIHVSFFNDVFAKTITTADLTLRELGDRILKKSGATKKQLPLLKLARFGDKKTDKGKLVSDENELEFNGIELDYDDLKITFEEAIKIVERSKLRAILYTSPSYNADTLKWRILLPLSKPETRLEMHPKYVARANGIFKHETKTDGNFFSGETFTLSQLYWYGKAHDNPAPNHQVIIIDGDFLDLRDDLFKYQDSGAKVSETAVKKDDGKKAKGFEAHLAQIGDDKDKGQTGFNIPIIKAIGAAAHDRGSSLDREDLKATIRDRIEKAPKGKNRHAADIQRYLSDRYLDAEIDRAIAKFGAKADIAAELPWRETTAKGFPIPSMHNARLAITELDIECSYDTFHNTLLIGFKGDQVRHELQSIVGEVSDNTIIMLRQIMSDRFLLDFKEQNTRDAVISLALEHCFDPVRDLIDKAQAEWDGVKRLDRMAVDYFNCEDTPLNRAFGRKMMIALVHRPRVPGCKFDNIVVLESDEGWNKSSAFNVLAGDDNFSDESILGKHSREVQEQLAAIWIYESADLAGMHKAEVETVKTFASRRFDIARPAYGRIVKKQPRHSIEVGTTNNEEYLQSQTGNRRFWTMKVLKSIDLDKLQRDRLQLLGEAATYESEGESVTLAEDLWSAATEAQEKRRTKDLWEDLIDEMTYAGVTTLSSAVIHLIDGEERVATSDILDNVLQLPPAQQVQSYAMRLSAVMKRLGWKRDGGNKITIPTKNPPQVRGYYRPAGMVHAQTVVVMSEGEDTTVADKIKTAGFEVVSHREFVNTKQYEKMGDLAPTVQTQITLTKSDPPDLFDRIRSTPKWLPPIDAFDTPRRKRHSARRKVRRSGGIL
jgi:predicted P-loop ATPase